MSDAPIATPDSQDEEAKKFVKTVKRGFDLSARVRNRGLRRGSITIFLDEELGPKLGWAYDKTDAFGNVVSRVREGVIGELDALPENADRAELEAKREELTKELTKTALVFELRAVPPIIQKSAHRLAKQTLGITEKGIPDEVAEDFNLAQSAHLMTLVVQSVTDNETGEVNTEMDYQEAIDIIDYIPPAQFLRLDMKMGEVQFTDAISQTIEGQEDFS